MTPTDLRTRLRTRPFVPFRVVTTDGTNYEVRHPDLVVLSLGAAFIGYPAPGMEGVAQRVDMVSLTGSVPEPSTWAMMFIGFGGLAYAGLRNRRREAVLAA